MTATEIRSKLAQLKQLDPRFEEFGSDQHEYELGEVISIPEVEDFEALHEIKLPEEYKTFITTVGNDGPGGYGGAGPFYGILPLGEFMYMEPYAKYMREDVMIRSTMNETSWSKMTEFDQRLDNGSEEYRLKYHPLSSGMMCIGTMGDQGQIMIVLNGKDVGRVVYFNQDLYMPVFKENFSAWYDTWLNQTMERLKNKK